MINLTDPHFWISLYFATGILVARMAWNDYKRNYPMSARSYATMPLFFRALGHIIHVVAWWALIIKWIRHRLQRE